MILLFDPDPPLLRWCAINQETRSEHQCVFEPGWADAVQQSVRDTAAVESIGYMSPHGGEALAETVTLLNQETLPARSARVGQTTNAEILTGKLIPRGRASGGPVTRRGRRPGKRRSAWPT